MEITYTLSTPHGFTGTISDDPTSDNFGCLSDIRGRTAADINPAYDVATGEYTVAPDDSWFDSNHATRDTSPVEFLTGDRICGPISEETTGFGGYVGPGDFFGNVIAYVDAESRPGVNIYTPLRTPNGQVVVFKDIEYAGLVQAAIEKEEGWKPDFGGIMVTSVRVRTPESYQTLLAWRAYREQEKANAATQALEDEASNTTEATTEE